MTKPVTKPVQPVPEENQSPKGPGSAPEVPLDTTKGHRDDEKQNIREQGDHGNMVQNTTDGAGEIRPSFRDGPKDQTSGAQLRTGESRDSPMCNSTS